MGNIRFDFGSTYNDFTRETADSLVNKINDLLAKFDMDADGFFNEILPHVNGFFVSSSNMKRDKFAEPDAQGKVRIPDFFFRLGLDSYANGRLRDNTVILKGELEIRQNTRDSRVYVRDFYPARRADKQPYEVFIAGSADYQNINKPGFSRYNDDITLDLAKNVPYIVDRTKFDKFINDWRSYLEFQKAYTVSEIRRYPINGGVEFKLVCDVADNAVNREEFEGQIVTEGRGKLLVDPNSPKLKGDEERKFLMLANINGREFGNAKEDILKSVRQFSGPGLSVIGQKQDNILTEFLDQYKTADGGKQANQKDLPEIRGFEPNEWLGPVYDEKTDRVTFRFLVSDDDGGYRRGTDPAEEIKNFGDKLFLARTASGDITLYNRGGKALSRIENGDVKNPYLAGFFIEPEKFENGSDYYSEKNVEFALKDLNRSQKEAVIKCLNSNSIFLLQGPPGTGKTQTITELVYQFNKEGKKVLMSSQTNIAIDNVIERLPKEMNILPIRLVQDRSKANERYLPERLLDNLYDAAYAKYRGKIETFETYEKNIRETEELFEANRSRHEKIRARLDAVKKSEEERDRLTKELSTLRSRENAKASELGEIERSLAVYSEYAGAGNRLPFESVSDDFVCAPLLERLHELAKKYKFEEQDDIYNYAVFFRRAAGRARIEYLNSLSKGGGAPDDLKASEEAVASVQKEIDMFKKYNTEIPKELEKKMNAALQAKKEALRKHEASGAKIINISSERFFFVRADGDAKKVIERELNAIGVFTGEYDEILKAVFNSTEFYNLKDKRDALTAELGGINASVGRTSVRLEDVKLEIGRQSEPIKSERKKLEEYFVSFYTDKLNGASLPETEREKFDGIREYINNEKRAFDEYKTEFNRLKDIYFSLVNYLEDRDDFVKPQRNKFTKGLLKKNANVYGMTCTSKSYFRSAVLSGGKNNDADDPGAVEVEDVDIGRIDFDVVIIDEVSKATPIEILIPVVYGKSVVLVGDQRQLPPIFKYRENAFYNKTPEERGKILQGRELADYQNMVETGLFEDIYNRLRRNRAMLTEQYRFNEQIMKCVNIFYDGKLSLGSGKEQNNKRQHYLEAGIKNSKGLITPVFCRKNSTYWFDSHFWADRKISYSEIGEGETSLRNLLEVRITVELLSLLEEGYSALKAGNPEEYRLSAGDGEKPGVAVITMYGRQIKSIKDEIKTRKMSFKNIGFNFLRDVSTVDDYQGKEKDIVLLNMVQNSRYKGASEFLKKFNRINVAISRARTMLIVVGSREFFSKVSVNVPDMETGRNNFIEAYYRIYERCESKWESTAGVFGLTRERTKA